MRINTAIEGTPTSVVGARIPVEYKIQLIRLAMKQKMGISEYASFLLCEHCIENIKKEGGKQLDFPPVEDTKTVQAIKKTKAKEIVHIAIKTPPVQPLPATKGKECTACEGEGKIQLRTGSRNMQECFKCNGTGKK